MIPPICEVSQLNVSRETSERLEILASLLIKWNPSINLVSKTTLGNLWSRHIHDSAQILKIAEHPMEHWLDIGSGGGFPGLVVAIMAAEAQSPKRVTLIESDKRKCVFLRTVLREAGIDGHVISERIENVTPQGADIISARAVASLNVLLRFLERHLGKNGVGLFLKGANWEKELNVAQESWSFDYETTKSETEPNSIILRIKDLRRA